MLVNVTWANFTGNIYSLVSDLLAFVLQANDSPLVINVLLFIILPSFMKSEHD